MRALITGVSSGIGASTETHLLQAGWHITGVDNQAPQNQSIDYCALDLSQLDACSHFAEHQHQPLDALIYCAGIREICNPCELSIEEWMRVLNVNLNAAFILSQAAIKAAMAQKKPLNIIFVASISGLQAEPDRAAYVTSKFGLIGLTKQLAFQFGSYGIRTNAIAPGIIETPLTQSYFHNEAQVKKIKETTPVGHWGQVEHILPIIDLLLTNSYMNGSVVVCDGGWTSGKEL
jgi:NAD(P)-dependent dehydrogenase (short-subunit alcohol dehydrogenase family)